MSTPRLIQITAGDFFVRDLRKHSSGQKTRTETSVKEELGSKIWQANQRMRGDFTETVPVTIWHGTGGGSSFSWSLRIEVIGQRGGGNWREATLEAEVRKVVNEMCETPTPLDNVIVQFV